jgi:fatty-acyl-CoA synthase
VILRANTVVVPINLMNVTEEEIIDWSKGHVEALPRSGSGKILWRELQEQERTSASQK